MTADGTPGEKNQPRFLDGGAPDLASDSNLISDFAALVGNRKVLTQAQREGLTGKEVWERLNVADTTTKLDYQYVNGSWRSSAPVSVRTGSGSVGTGISVIALSDTQLMTDTSVFIHKPGVTQVVVRGLYRIIGGLDWQSNATGSRTIEVSVNGNAFTPKVSDTRPTSGPTSQTAVGLVELPANAEIRLTGQQTSGVTLNYASRLSVELVIPL